MSRLIILNRDEQEKVEYLAKQFGVSPDDYVRAAIKFYSACRNFGYEYDNSEDSNAPKWWTGEGRGDILG